MDIRLKRLRLENFKGARSAEYEFNSGGVTRVMGRNGSGKSTIADAVNWVLYGKDAKGNKEFGVKTRDADCTVIPRLVHTVEAVFEFDGREMVMKRSLVEKWQRRSGEAEESFVGNTEELWYDGVPCKASEYKTAVAEVCREDVFRYVSDPSFFLTRKKEEKRAFLMGMAGGESAEIKSKYAELIERMGGKSAEDYLKVVRARKKKAMEEVATIPSKIEAMRGAMADEARRDDEATGGYRCPACGREVARDEYSRIRERRDAVWKGRIKEMEERMREQGRLLSEAEREEYLLGEMKREETEIAERSINSEFNLVRWRFREPLVGGGEAECCEAFLRGVQYRDLNTAGRIEAGCEVIGALGRMTGVSAPVIIDNAESLNELPDMLWRQVVAMYVSEDEGVVID